MEQAARAWPQKTREIQSAVSDSTRWNEFRFRNDDIVIATYAKTGTTWTQQIVGEFIFCGARTALFAGEVSPWVDFRPLPWDQVQQRIEAQQHRRFLKTHLPLDAMVFLPQVKYIYVARDGRDTAWSLYNHLAGFTDQGYAMINSAPGRTGPLLERPAGDVVQFFREWLDGAGLPLGASFWQHTQGWFDASHLPNVLLVHFNNLKADLPREMKRIAAFLGIEIEEDLWPTLIEHCSIGYMRNLSLQSPMMNTLFQDGGHTFFHMGVNGRWRDLLSTDDIERYEAAARANLTPACAHWVATGELTQS